MPMNYPKIQYGGFVPTVINFPYPPTEGKRRETREANRRETDSLSGVRQVQTNYVEALRRIKFRFLSEADIDALEEFFNYAVKGKVFKFFEDQNDLDFKLYELDQRRFEPKEITSVGANAYIYEAELNFRRVLDSEGADGYMQVEIQNNVGPVDVDGLVLDNEKYRSAKVFFEVFRKTSLEERVNNGDFTAIYKDGAWDMAPGSLVGDPLAGVEFTITPAGQVQYTADDMAGADYQGEVLFRNFTVIGG